MARRSMAVHVVTTIRRYKGPINYFQGVTINNTAGQTLHQYSTSRPMFAESLDVAGVAAEVMSNNDVRVTLTGIHVLRSMGQLQDQLHLERSNPLLPRVTEHSILRYQSGTAGRLDVLVEGSSLNAVTGAVMVGAVSAPALAITPISSQQFLLEIPVASSDLSQPLLVALQTSRGTLAVLTIVVPEPPRIERIHNPITQAARGDSNGGYPVTLAGLNLQHIAKVFFGSVEATVLGATSDRLQVQVPKGSPGKVSVRLETEIVYLGKPLTNLRQLGDVATAAQAQFE